MIAKFSTPVKLTPTLLIKARSFLAAAAMLLAGSAAQAQYCTPNFLTGCTADDDIHTFQVGGAAGTFLNDSATGCSPAAYRNMTSMAVSVAQGGAYTAYVNTEYSDEGVQVFIDFNNDNTFSASETVGGVNYVDNIGSNFNIHIPASAPLGSHRVRVVLSYEFQYPNISPCPDPVDYEYGEVHDYTASVIAGGPACNAPNVISASAMTPTGAELYWSPVAGALGYEYAISQTNVAPLVAGTAIAANTLTATGLSSGQQYFLHVRTRCGPTTFSPWIFRAFVTDISTPTCTSPGGFTATVSGSQATLSWSAPTGSLGYEIFLTDVPSLYPLNGTAWTGTSATYTGLDPFTEYYAYLRHECSNQFTSDWSVLTLTTGGLSTTGGSISGSIFKNNIPAPSVDTYTVWLIDYDSVSTTLTAIDSVVTTNGTYSFSNVANGAYRVKAAQQTAAALPLSLGQVPTYHDSSLYWNTALTATLSPAVTTLANRNIWMQQGTVTSGPGFVGGNVSLGANKGTTAGVSNLLIYLRNAANKLVKATYTDAAGNFSFGSLPVGAYSVYPEKMGYATTPATAITLTTAQPSRTAINFNQDDAQESIKPRTTSISEASAGTLAASLAPNPAKGTVGIYWSRLSEALHIDVMNTTGQTVRTEIVRPAGRTSYLLDIVGLPAGLYTVRLQSGAQRAVQKLVVAP